MTDGKSILVIAKFGTVVSGEARVSKIETHIQPIADATDRVDYVSAGPVSEQTTGINYYSFDESNFKLFTLFKQFLIAMRLAVRNDYDLIVSFSLPPYGIFALLLKYLTRTPAHLGIIGADLDVHANAKYGPIIVWLFNRFDVISVAGQEYEERLIEFGIPSDRIYTVLHPVSSEFSQASVGENPSFDLLWLTRMSSEKDPLLFIEILDELRDRSVDYSAAMVGSGPMESEVKEAIRERGLQNYVATPGWTDIPVEYYRDARIYVLTSSREMLPLTLVEAMFVGLPPVVPPKGAIPDVVKDGKNGIIVHSRDVETYADKIESLLIQEELQTELGTNAKNIVSVISDESVSDTWKEIFSSVES